MHMFKNASQISKISADYFGYFLRLGQSYNYYLSANDKSLLISTEYLQKDIGDFNKMTIKFSEQVRVLDDSAMKYVDSYFRHMIRGKNFEDNRAMRFVAREKYLKAKERCDKTLSQLNNQHGELLHKITVAERQVETSKMMIKSLNQEKDHNMHLRAATRQRLNSLSEMEIKLV